MASNYNANVSVNFKINSGSSKAVVNAFTRQLASQKLNIPVNLKFKTVNVQTVSRQNAAFRALNSTIKQLGTSSSKSAAQLNSLYNAVRHVNSGLNNFGSSRGLQSFNSNVGKAAVGIKNVGNQFKQANDNVIGFSESVGISARRFLSFGIAAAVLAKVSYEIRNATMAAVEFDHEMVKLKQVSHGGNEEIAGIAKTISGLGINLGVDSAQMAKTAVTLRQAGLSATETKKALDVLGKTTLSPTFEDLHSTTEGLIALFNQFDNNINNLEKHFSAISQVSADFAVESSDLVEALKRTGGAFKAAGGDVNQLLAMYTTVRQTTRESAESIATGMRTILARLQDPAIAKKLHGIGVEVYDLKGQFVGPYEAVERLSNALKKLPQGDIRASSILKDIGGLRQLSRVIPLVYKNDITHKALQSARSSMNRLDEDAKIAQEALVVQLTRIKEGFLDLFRVISTDSSVRTTLQYIASGIEKITEAMRTLKPLIPFFLALTTVKVGQSIFQGYSSFKRGFTAPVKGYSQGGWVTGGTPGKDSVPAMLMPGEYVVPAKQARHLAKGGKIDFSIDPDKALRFYNIQRNKYYKNLEPDLLKQLESYRTHPHINRLLIQNPKLNTNTTQKLDTSIDLGIVKADTRVYRGIQDQDIFTQARNKGDIIHVPQYVSTSISSRYARNFGKVVGIDLPKGLKSAYIKPGGGITSDEYEMLLGRNQHFVLHDYQNDMPIFKPLKLAKGGIIKSSLHRKDYRYERNMLAGLFKGEGGKKVYRHLQSVNAKFLDAGAEAAVFKNDQNRVFRIANIHNRPRRVDSELMLQALEERKFGQGNSTRFLEELPFTPPLDKTIKPIPYDRFNRKAYEESKAKVERRQDWISEAFAKRVISQGYLAKDVHAGNLARVNKKIVAIDPTTFVEKQQELNKNRNNFLKALGFAKGGVIKRTSDLTNGLGYIDFSRNRELSRTIYDKISRKFSTKLTKKELESLMDYARGENYFINSVLRGEDIPYHANDYIPHLDSALSKFKIPFSTRVYRGTSQKEAEIVRNLKEGDIYHNKGYLSTSINPSVSKYEFGKDILSLKLPRGFKAAPLKNISDYPEQEEIVLPRGLSYRVTGRDNDMVFGEPLGFAEGGLVPAKGGRLAKKAKFSGKYYLLEDMMVSGGRKQPSGSIGQRTRLRRVEIDPETGAFTPRARWYAAHRQNRFLKKFARGGQVFSPHFEQLESRFLETPLKPRGNTSTEFSPLQKLVKITMGQRPPMVQGGKMFKGKIKGYAKGGSIFQPQGTDTVPAMLTPGEFVIPKAAAQKFGYDNLEKIRSGAFDADTIGRVKSRELIAERRSRQYGVESLYDGYDTLAEHLSHAVLTHRKKTAQIRGNYKLQTSPGFYTQRAISFKKHLRELINEHEYKRILPPFKQRRMLAGGGEVGATAAYAYMTKGGRVPHYYVHGGKVGQELTMEVLQDYLDKAKIKLNAKDFIKEIKFDKDLPRGGRGKFNFKDRTITLGPNANIGTLLHEFGHSLHQPEKHTDLTSKYIEIPGVEKKSLYGNGGLKEYKEGQKHKEAFANTFATYALNKGLTKKELKENFPHLQSRLGEKEVKSLIQSAGQHIARITKDNNQTSSGVAAQIAAPPRKPPRKPPAPPATPEFSPRPDRDYYKKKPTELVDKSGMTAHFPGEESLPIIQGLKDRDRQREINQLQDKNFQPFNPYNNPIATKKQLSEPHIIQSKPAESSGIIVTSGNSRGKIVSSPDLKDLQEQQRQRELEARQFLRPGKPITHQNIVPKYLQNKQINKEIEARNFLTPEVPYSNLPFQGVSASHKNYTTELAYRKRVASAREFLTPESNFTDLQNQGKFPVAKQNVYAQKRLTRSNPQQFTPTLDKSGLPIIGASFAPSKLGYANGKVPIIQAAPAPQLPVIKAAPQQPNNLINTSLNNMSEEELRRHLINNRGFKPSQAEAHARRIVQERQPTSSSPIVNPPSYGGSPPSYPSRPSSYPPRKPPYRFPKLDTVNLSDLPASYISPNQHIMERVFEEHFGNKKEHKILGNPINNKEFKYIAKNNLGEKVSGVLQGNSTAHVEDLLRYKGLEPSKVKETLSSKLGFAPKDENLKRFRYSHMDENGLHGMGVRTILANSEKSARNLLQQQGKFVTSIKQVDDTFSNRFFPNFNKFIGNAKKNVDKLKNKADKLDPAMEMEHKNLREKRMNAGLLAASIAVPMLTENIFGNAKNPGVGGKAGVVTGNALSGAVGGAAIGSSFGPWGTAIGALAGAALSAAGALDEFSEEAKEVRLKELNEEINKIKFDPQKGTFKTQGDRNKVSEILSNSVKAGVEKEYNTFGNRLQSVFTRNNSFDINKYTALKTISPEEKEALSGQIKNLFLSTAQQNPNMDYAEISKKIGTFNVGKIQYNAGDVLGLDRKNVEEVQRFLVEQKKAASIQEKMNAVMLQVNQAFELTSHELEAFGNALENSGKQFSLRQQYGEMSSAPLRGQIMTAPNSINTGALASRNPIAGEIHSFAKEGGGYDQSRQALLGIVNQLGKENIMNTPEGSLNAGIRAESLFKNAGVGGKYSNQIGETANAIIMNTPNIHEKLQNEGAAPIVDQILGRFKHIKDAGVNSDKELQKTHGQYQAQQIELHNRQFEQTQRENELSLSKAGTEAFIGRRERLSLPQKQVKPAPTVRSVIHPSKFTEAETKQRNLQQEKVNAAVKIENKAARQRQNEAQKIVEKGQLRSIEKNLPYYRKQGIIPNRTAENQVAPHKSSKVYDRTVDKYRQLGLTEPQISKALDKLDADMVLQHMQVNKTTAAPAQRVTAKTLEQKVNSGAALSKKELRFGRRKGIDVTRPLTGGIIEDELNPETKFINGRSYSAEERILDKGYKSQNNAFREAQNRLAGTKGEEGLSVEALQEKYNENQKRLSEVQKEHLKATTSFTPLEEKKIATLQERVGKYNNFAQTFSKAGDVGKAQLYQRKAQEEQGKINEMYKGKDADTIKNLDKEMSALQASSRGVVEALNQLKNSTQSVEYAQKKYQMAVDALHADKNSRKSDANILTFGSRQEKMQLMMKENLTQQALSMNPEQFASMSDQAKKMVFERLQETPGMVRAIPQYDKYMRPKQPLIMDSEHALEQMRKPAMQMLENNVATNTLRGRVRQAGMEKAKAEGNQQKAAEVLNTMNNKDIAKGAVQNEDNYQKFLSSLNEGVNKQMEASARFIEQSAELTKALNNFDGKLTIERNGKIEVVLNGMSILQAMKGDLEKEIMQTITNKLEEIKKQPAR